MLCLVKFCLAKNHDGRKQTSMHTPVKNLMQMFCFVTYVGEAFSLRNLGFGHWREECSTSKV